VAKSKHDVLLARFLPTAYFLSIRYMLPLLHLLPHHGAMTPI